MEEQDPQDTAVLSDDMDAPKVEQQEVRPNSVYDGIVRLAMTHGKMYRTNGKRADMLRFDLTSHAVFAGNAFIVSHGELKMPVVETAALKIDMTGLPWLTDEERKLDPQELFRDHYLSRPNGSEKFMASNFRAKDIDEMTDDEIAAGMPRSEARIRLEAWILCAALDGTLEKYVTSHANWCPGNWWWSPRQGNEADENYLVIRTCWWAKSAVENWELLPPVVGRQYRVAAKGRDIAALSAGLDDVTSRTIQMAPRSLSLAKSLAHEVFKFEMRTKCYDLDPIINEINKLATYIATGR